MVQDRDAPCQLQPRTHSRLSRSAHASAPLRWLSVMTRRSTRACDARAPCRAGSSRLVPYAGPLHRRDVSLHRCKTVVRRAGCGLQGTAGFREARTRVCHCTHCLAKRAPCRAGCYRVMQHERPLHRRNASLHRRKTMVRRASCGLQHTDGSRVASTRARHCACYFSGGGTVRLLATLARRAALVVVALCTRQGHPH